MEFAPFGTATPLVEVLDAARSLAVGNPLVFPNRSGNRIRDTFLSQLLKDLDIAAVPHGFRSSFRTGRPRRRTTSARSSRRRWRT